MGMQQNQVSPRQLALGRYRSARVDLLIVIIFTVLNIALLFGQADTMMLFSATVPYVAVVIGYAANIEAGGGLEWFVTGSLIFAFVILAMYLVCWFFSKRRYGWLLAGLVLFGLDTVATVLLYMGNLGEGIMDILIHGIVIYYLVMGVKAGKQLKTLPEEAVEAEGSVASGDAPQVPLENSTPLRWADPELKHRVLVETEVQGLRICYRKVKGVLELVINGYVYAETKMAIIVGHEQSAVFNGHLVTAGFNPTNSNSYICVDGQQVAKKFTM